VDSLRKNAEKVVTTLTRSGFMACFAGGCVRDMMMNNRPVDYDIATDARPEDVIELFETVVPVGREFGVVVVVLGGQSYEVATFRREGVYEDGRRPSSVQFTDAAEEDARRRDFTINGIFYDPLRDEYLDYVGGREDIRSGIVRCVGDPRERFSEDRLRILRAIRFASRFGFTIDPETRDAIRGLAPSARDVSAERIRDELVKVLLGPHPDEGIRLMQELGVLEVILPEISKMDGVEQPAEFHPEGDVLTHTLLMLHEMALSSSKHFPLEPMGSDAGDVDSADIESRGKMVLAMGVLLHDVGKPETMQRKDRIRFNNHTGVGAEIALSVMKRLRFSRRDMREVVSLVKDHLKFIEVKRMRDSTLKRFMMTDGFPTHLELHRLDCLASHGDLENYHFCAEKLDEMARTPPPLQCLLTGDDLIRLGFKPGPVFKEILSFIEDMQLEGRISTRQEAIEAVGEQKRRRGW